MLHPYKDMETLSLYAQEQEEFAILQDQERNRKRRQRRRRAVMWLLRRL